MKNIVDVLKKFAQIKKFANELDWYSRQGNHVVVKRNNTKFNTTNLEKAGITCENLDELVHEVASSLASDTNNSGLPAQLEFLVSNDWTEEDVIKYFNE